MSDDMLALTKRIETLEKQVKALVEAVSLLNARTRNAGARR